MLQIKAFPPTPARASDQHATDYGVAGKQWRAGSLIYVLLP